MFGDSARARAQKEAGWPRLLIKQKGVTISDSVNPVGAMKHSSCFIRPR